jgi:hypothetical protein
MVIREKRHKSNVLVGWEVWIGIFFRCLNSHKREMYGTQSVAFRYTLKIPSSRD